MFFQVLSRVLAHGYLRPNITETGKGNENGERENLKW